MQSFICQSCNCELDKTEVTMIGLFEEPETIKERKNYCTACFIESSGNKLQSVLKDTRSLSDNFVLIEDFECMCCGKNLSKVKIKYAIYMERELMDPSKTSIVVLCQQCFDEEIGYFSD